MNHESGGVRAIIKSSTLMCVCVCVEKERDSKARIGSHIRNNTTKQQQQQQQHPNCLILDAAMTTQLCVRAQTCKLCKLKVLYELTGMKKSFSLSFIHSSELGHIRS